MKKYFLRLLQYNFWANRRVLGLLEHGRPEDNQALRLFAHILAVEKLWMNRLRNRNGGTPVVFPELPVEGCLPLLAENTRAWTEFLESFPEDDFFRLIAYKDTKGDLYQTPVAEIMANVVNHGTYHRGQIAIRLREAGIQPPETDFYLFSRPV